MFSVQWIQHDYSLSLAHVGFLLTIDVNNYVPNTGSCIVASFWVMSCKYANCVVNLSSSLT
jgi:hypothetical protein